MDMHVRNVDPHYVKEIDKRCKQISKRLGKRYYRSDYINDMFTKHFEEEYQRNKEDKFDEVIGNVTVTLERQEQKIQEYIDATNELMIKLAERE